MKTAVDRKRAVARPAQPAHPPIRPAAAAARTARAGHKAPPQDAEARPQHLNLGVIVWLAVIHAGALAAFWTFSWSGLLLVVILHWITGGLGVCLGYHRLFTHQSFRTYAPLRWLIGLLGCLSGEGDPIVWVAVHRKHHALSDQPGDPHSPRDGAWWSHILWIGWTHPTEVQQRFLQKWAPDLLKDAGLRIVSRGFLVWNILFAALVFGAGYLAGGMVLAWSWLSWGIFLRLALVLHSTWLVNSASHMWGYRNYTTTDDSRNLWWVALITYGEGWHNNHHAFPRMAAHGHRRWEIDVTYAAICLMERLGLAWDVVHRQRGSVLDPSA